MSHVRPFAVFLHNRLAHVGPAREVTSAIFYQLGLGSGFDQIHFTSAGPMLLSLLRTLLPSVHLILMDHDTCLTCLWEVEELGQLASVTLELQEEQPNIQHDHVWQYSPEAKHACVPGSSPNIAALLITEDEYVYDANAGLVVFVGDTGAR